MQNIRNIASHNTLQHWLIPAKPRVGSPTVALCNKSYLFWKDFWLRIFQENGTNDTPNPDEFFRQDWLSVITRGKRGTVIALHTYTLFNLEQIAAREHSYVTGHFTQRYMDELQARGCRSAMTMEYFAVASEWRSGQLGVPLASVLLGLGLNVARSLEIDVIMGIARTDVGVDKMTHKFGAITVDKGLQLHNTPCDLVAFFRENFQEHRDPQVREFTSTLWKNCLNFTSPKQRKIKNAA